MARKIKRVRVDKIQRKIKKKEKMSKENRESRGEAAYGVDWISELPEHLIHHILSRFRCSKDVARTSVLSKKWGTFWLSFHDIDLDQRYFHPHISKTLQAAGAEKIDFMNYVNSTERTRIKQLCFVNILKLNVINLKIELAFAMNECIFTALEKGIQELEIHVKRVKGRLYTVPQGVFASKTLTSLKLHGCRLGDFAAIELSNLRQLSLKKIPISEGIIQNFFKSCPLIEDFRLVECMNLQILHVPVLLNLKRVEVHKCIGLHSIGIKGTSLQTFCFCEKERIHYNIELDSNEILRSLTIKASKMTDEWFQDQISKFPDLENLTLLKCSSLKRITLLSSKLKRLSLLRCFNLDDANIVAPNLTSFEYTGESVCFSNMASSRLLHMKINFESGLCESETEKFNEIIGLLEGFNMVLQESGQNGVNIYEGSSGIILPQGSGYKIELTKSPLILREIIYRKLQECRPSVFYVSHSPSHSESIQIIEKMLENIEEGLSCCHYYKNKCWKHHLDKYGIFKNEGGDSSFRPVWLSGESSSVV